MMSGNSQTPGRGESAAICIIGMHRSGTSLVARALQRCGLELGPADRLLTANESNPLGYFENEGFVALNDRLLAHLGGSWDNPPAVQSGWERDPSVEPYRVEARELVRTFPRGAHWGWKDPRTTLLLPFWKTVVEPLRFVICVRSPLDVARSLHTRDGIPAQTAAYLWTRYTTSAIRDTDDCSRLFTFYDDYFVNAPTELERLARFCGLEQPSAEELGDVAAVGLKHHASAEQELWEDDEITAEAKLLYTVMRASTRGVYGAAVLDGSRTIGRMQRLLEQRFEGEREVPRLQAAVDSAERRIASLRETIETQRQQTVEQQRTIDQLVAANRAMANSRSWQWTAPLRRLYDGLSGARRRRKE